MASLKSVKNRKDIVLTIKKITKAMELVATSKIKKAKRNCDKVSQYCLRIEEAFNNLNLNIKKWSDIISINPSNPKAFIVITSDLGMCGAYNSNILKLAKTKISEQDYLFIIGSKGIKIFRKHFNKDKIILSFENVGVRSSAGQSFDFLRSFWFHRRYKFREHIAPIFECGAFHAPHRSPSIWDRRSHLGACLS